MEEKNFIEEAQKTLKAWNEAEGYRKTQELLNEAAQQTAQLRHRAESAEKALGALSGASVELPKDRDGEYIHVGDKVFSVGGPASGEVAKVSVSIGSEGVAYVEIEVREGDGTFFSFPYNLTHKAPEPEDSWEKFEEDLALTPSDYARENGIEYSIFDLKSLAVRHAEHVAARAKKLLEADRG